MDDIILNLNQDFIYNENSVKDHFYYFKTLKVAPLKLTISFFNSKS